MRAPTNRNSTTGILKKLWNEVRWPLLLSGPAQDTPLKLPSGPGGLHSAMLAHCAMSKPRCADSQRGSRGEVSTVCHLHDKHGMTDVDGPNFKVGEQPLNTIQVEKERGIPPAYPEKTRRFPQRLALGNRGRLTGRSFLT